MIHRVIPLIGMANPTPTPATAVLIPTSIAGQAVGRSPSVSRVQGSVRLNDVIDDPYVVSVPCRQRPTQCADDTGRGRFQPNPSGLPRPLRRAAPL